MSKVKGLNLGRRYLFQSAPLMIALSAALSGCGGSGEGSGEGDTAGAGGEGAGGEGAGGMANNIPSDLKPEVEGADPGRVAIHRLNNTEYNNTVHDLLGTNLQPASGFLSEEGLTFDNIASSLGMTPPQYEAYFNAAKTLADDVFGNPTLTAGIMTCVPTMADDPCATQIINAFGLRAFRRPLSETEVTAARGVFNEELARKNDGTLAIKQVVLAMLASPGFLYRVEADADPNSVTVHPLNGYELASRLSYFQTSSMPDDELMNLAATGELLKGDVLEAQVDRLIATPRVGTFIESFAGQWLDVRELITHSVQSEIFPTYTNALRDAMMQETYMWFYDFLSTDRDVNTWFTADFNYVNGVLAQHYGFPAPSDPNAFTKVEITTDQRVGFLGLASFLTQTSFPSRTTPPKRAAWVLSELLCAPPAQPPPNVPKLDDPNDTEAPAPGTENVRARLEVHRDNDDCRGCHSLLDPIGLGLEQYDGIGQYRDHYGNGDPIDASGEFPDGTKFNGAAELSQIMSSDQRFANCMTKKVFSYALGREIDKTADTPYLDKIRTDWTSRGTNLRNLIKEVVQSDTFRFRRGETL
jgi:hypothetical protein